MSMIDRRGHIQTDGMRVDRSLGVRPAIVLRFDTAEKAILGE